MNNLTESNMMSCTVKKNNNNNNVMASKYNFIFGFQISAEFRTTWRIDFGRYTIQNFEFYI